MDTTKEDELRYKLLTAKQICREYDTLGGFDKMFDSNHDIITYIDPADGKEHKDCLNKFFFKEIEPWMSLIKMDTGECNEETEYPMTTITLENLNKIWDMLYSYRQVRKAFEVKLSLGRKEANRLLNTACFGANIAWHYYNSEPDNRDISNSIYHVLKNSLTYYKQDEDN